MTISTAKVADALMAVERGEIRRLMISAPPRHGKTQLVSKRFPLWYLGRNPNTQIIHCGYGGERRSPRTLAASAQEPHVQRQPLDVFPELHASSRDSTAVE